MSGLNQARAQLLQTLRNKHRAFPIVRRRFPQPGDANYVWKPLFGVQPITQPTGFVFYQDWLETQGKKG